MSRSLSFATSKPHTTAFHFLQVKMRLTCESYKPKPPNTSDSAPNEAIHQQYELALGVASRNFWRIGALGPTWQVKTPSVSLRYLEGHTLPLFKGAQCYMGRFCYIEK